MKHEWRKHEKALYMPKNQAEIVSVPKFGFFTLKGRGNPNSDFFAACIEALYALSYAVRMSYKSGAAPEGYYEYTVYPLEGVWDIDESAKAHFNGVPDKNSLVFELMIRQPAFVTADFADQIMQKTRKKLPHDLSDQVGFKTFEEGHCIQMLHIGSYDSEPESFRRMETFAREHGLVRKTHTHREIYLTDARTTPPPVLKTVLRFQV